VAIATYFILGKSVAIIVSKRTRQDWIAISIVSQQISSQMAVLLLFHSKVLHLQPLVHY
jgi:hypothetical protein